MQRSISLQISISLAIIFFEALVSSLLFHGESSADLLASWLAGVFYGKGAFDQIYPNDSSVYTMLPPSDWLSYLRARGYEGNIFPYVYPPLWAWVFSWLGRITDFDHVNGVASFLNPLLLASLPLLAWRICGSQISAARFTFLGGVALFATSPGEIALFQNQPQILVSFLILLAVERSRAKVPLAAGAALALASAIKLYPALFALLWLATGQRRSFFAFLGFGASLGALSIAVAGWPLHMSFLREISAINNSALVTSFSFSLDPTIAQIFFHDHLQFITATKATNTAASMGWHVLHKPKVWSILSALLLLATLMRLSAMMRAQSDKNRGLLWPLSITVIALVSPLSWGYYYLPAIAFAPAFLEKLGAFRGGALLLIVFMPLTLPAMFLFNRSVHGLSSINYPNQILGTVLMAAYALALAYSARKQPKNLPRAATDWR